MNELVHKTKKGTPVTTSLRVAQKFGKEHKNVLRAIDDLISQLSEDQRKLNFALTYMDVKMPIGGGSRRDRYYIMTRDGFTLLVMGFTGEEALTFKLEFIDAFDKMAMSIKNDDSSSLKTTKDLEKMSSREIAELTGKEHRNVLADCDKLNENYHNLTLAEISAGVYLHQNTGNQQHREYLLTRIQCLDLMTGYSTELRIKVNRRWEELESKKQLDFSSPETVLMLAQNWKEEYDKRMAAEQAKAVLEKENAILFPKAELMDVVMATDSKIDIGQVAKILGLSYGRNTLFKVLKEKGIFFSNRNEPKQEYIDRGYFELKEKCIKLGSFGHRVIVKTLVTQKGLDFVAKILNVVPSKELILEPQAV
jgi:Rha family phage regulatory protein